MRTPAILLVMLSTLAAACSSTPAGAPARTFPMQGQIFTIEPDRLHAVIDHEEIKGFMMAMTMTYRMKDAKVLDGIVPGDLITATLVVLSNDASITEVRKTGHKDIPKATEAPPASSGFELIKVGADVPDANFLDQDGKKRTFSSFKGSPVAITFIYTSCPLPTFCPLMDRHFASVQDSIKSDAALRKVQLVSVSFDPITDTPAVLKAHARELKADPARWTFLTGDRDEIDQFAARFGVSVTRAQNDPKDIAHTLRTAIIDADGRLVKVYIGNEWTPAELLADLKPVAHAG
jgi:protein SCO1/2